MLKSKPLGEKFPNGDDRGGNGDEDDPEAAEENIVHKHLSELLSSLVIL